MLIQNIILIWTKIVSFPIKMYWIIHQSTCPSVRKYLSSRVSYTMLFSHKLYIVLLPTKCSIKWYILHSDMFDMSWKVWQKWLQLWNSHFQVFLFSRTYTKCVFFSMFFPILFRFAYVEFDGASFGYKRFFLGWTMI
jgi:hypothetical protein